MTSRKRIPAAPKGLKRAGKSLWRSILGDLGAGWELDARERYLLERACRCADELDQLEVAVDAEGPITTGSRGQSVVHPALAEARQLRLVQLRLLSAIEMADPQGQISATPAQAQARRAANTRWARHG